MTVTALVLGLIGAVVTLAIFVSTLIFRMGHQTARVEALEQWRTSVRSDFHEVSDQMEALKIGFAEVRTIIDERLPRRLP